MSDTPRTDAVASYMGTDEQLHHATIPEHKCINTLVTADFARQLERELNDYKALYQGEQRAVAATEADRDHLKQRAEAAEQDSKRLDWLEKKAVDIVVMRGIDRFQIIPPLIGVRTAIDQAMRKETNE